jgi:aminomethyltransferase
MEARRATALRDEHVRLSGGVADFEGYGIPDSYGGNVRDEHLHTRGKAGVFDVSNMGRFFITGPERVAFLQRALTNNCEALGLLESQYTILSDDSGVAVDDAYLYRFFEDSFLLVVGAENAGRDLAYLTGLAGRYDVAIEDRSEGISMVSIQGPASKGILLSVADGPSLTEPMRNSLGFVRLGGREAWLSKTGYTGEPLGYEIFVPRDDAAYIWNLLIEKGARPVGLGARETLRIEAGLPRYGHEIGAGPAGGGIPIYATALAKPAVSFAEPKGNFIGRDALKKQSDAYGSIFTRGAGDVPGLPRVVRHFCVEGEGVPVAGAKVSKGGEEIGIVTSCAVAPYYITEGKGLETALTDKVGERTIGSALVRPGIPLDGGMDIEVAGGTVKGIAVACHLLSDAPPYARTIVHGHGRDTEEAPRVPGGYSAKAAALIKDARANHLWRQSECINLIPSEQSHSRAARILSILDPSFRYAEHRKMKSLYDFDVFYYQGTKFIHKVELMLADEFREYFGCENVELRATSGQMANAAVFSALMDWKNRADRKVDAKRLGYVMNNHIIRGGHLSAQPMGALHDYIAIDPRTEKPAVVNFPVLPGNPFKIDTAAAIRLIEEYRPELIVFGKSMVLHREPVAEIRKAVDALGVETTIMYDMAHVLGLAGPHFQDPFAEGADIVTGSTHKTFFGTQRGVIAAGRGAGAAKRGMWGTIESRIFPGSVSNHHLGTLLGLLLSAYEMNCFKDEYQRKVIENAKAFAKSLADAGLDVAGDPDISYTETHQVILRVGYASGAGIAEKLEANNIIVNYQATPDEEGFTASGALRMGVSEMTRFGWGSGEFGKLAALIADLVLHGRDVGEEAKALRSGYTEMKYCFTDDELGGEMGRLVDLLR